MTLPTTTSLIATPGSAKSKMMSRRSIRFGMNWPNKVTNQLKYKPPAVRLPGFFLLSAAFEPLQADRTGPGIRRLLHSQPKAEILVKLTGSIQAGKGRKPDPVVPVLI